MGNVSDKNQGKKMIIGRQELREKYMAEFLLLVETIMLLHFELSRG